MRRLTRRTFGLLAIGGAGAATLGSRKAPAAAGDKIGIAVLPLVSHAPTFIAAGKGYFAQHGLDASLVSFQAAEPAAVAIAAGDVNFGVTAITGGLISLADKGAVKVIGGALQETTGVEGEKILASKQAHGDGVTDPAKLKGRSFGITTAGSSFHYMAHKIAQKEGFAASDFVLKPLQRIPVLIAALKTGQIDAWSIVPNIADPLIENGDAFAIGKIADFIPNYQVTTVFTSSADIAKRPDVVKRFVAAFSQGVADYNAALVDKTMGKDETAAIVAMIHKHVYSSEPLDKADPMIRAAAMRINPDARMNLASIKDQLDWFTSENLVTEKVTMEKLVDTSFAPTE